MTNIFKNLYYIDNFMTPWMPCYRNQEHSESISSGLSISREAKAPLLSPQTPSEIVSLKITQPLIHDQLTIRHKPIFQLLHELYTHRTERTSLLNSLMTHRVNPDLTQLDLSFREDLEFYIPEIVAYLVVEEGLSNQQANELVLDCCATDFFFAHSTYFYLRALGVCSQNQPIQQVADFIKQVFLPKMTLYKGSRLAGYELFRAAEQRRNQDSQSSMILFQPDQFHIPEVEYEPITVSITHHEQIDSKHPQFTYGLKDYPYPPPLDPQRIEGLPILKIYKTSGFDETPTFLDDLLEVGNKLCLTPHEGRLQSLHQLISTEVNLHLPAKVYLPFFKDNIRLSTVLCVWANLVFSTKERAPFSLLIELWSQQEEEQEQEDEENQQEHDQIAAAPSDKAPSRKPNLLERLKQTISKPLSVIDGKNSLNLRRLFNGLSQIDYSTKKRKQLSRSFSGAYSSSNDSCKGQSKLSSMIDKSMEDESNFGFMDWLRLPNERVKNELVQNGAVREKCPSSGGNRKQSEQGEVSSDWSRSRPVSCSHSPKMGAEEEVSNGKDPLSRYFPQRFHQKVQDVRKRSIFGHLRSWRLMHFMVKVGDDLRQCKMGL